MFSSHGSRGCGQANVQVRNTQGRRGRASRRGPVAQQAQAQRHQGWQRRRLPRCADARRFKALPKRRPSCPTHDVLLLAMCYAGNALEWWRRRWPLIARAKGMSVCVVLLTRGMVDHFPRPILLLTLKTATSAVMCVYAWCACATAHGRRLLVQHLLCGTQILALTWDELGSWEYSCMSERGARTRWSHHRRAAFLFGASRAALALALYDANFAVVCAFQALAVLGRQGVKRPAFADRVSPNKARGCGGATVR